MLRDPLVWRAGDGPMAEWLAGVGERLLGPQPGGCTVRGDLRWPDQPYGVPVGTGLSLDQVAELLTAEGVDGLYVRTGGGPRLAGPWVEIAPLAEGDRGPDGPGVRILQVEPAGAPAGTVPVFARIRTPDGLGAWIGLLAPLLAQAPPPARWPATTLATPLGATFHHRRDGILLDLQPLAEAEQRGVNATSRVQLQCAAADFPQRTVLLAAAAVLEERPLPGVRDLAGWLAELAAAWGGQPVPVPGRWAGAAALPPGTRASVRRIEGDEAELMLRRPGRSELWARGPVTRVAGWARPLLDPALHEEVPTASRRRLARWLEHTGRAALGAGARWSVDRLAEPLTAVGLADWLAAHCPGRAVAVERVTAEAVTLTGTRTADGRATVTGRRSGHP
jgi:hypothetical protein